MQNSTLYSKTKQNLFRIRCLNVLNAQLNMAPIAANSDGLEALSLSASDIVLFVLVVSVAVMFIKKFFNVVKISYFDNTKDAMTKKSE